LQFKLHTIQQQFVELCRQ